MITIGIQIYTTINFLKVDEETFRDTFNLIETYINKKSLMRFSTQYSKKGLYVLEKTYRETIVKNSASYEEFNFIGELETGRSCENFSISNEVFSYLNPVDYELYLELKDKSIQEKYIILESKGKKNDIFIKEILGNKTQGEKYHWDLVTITLIMLHSLGDAVKIDGCILNSQIENSKKELHDLLGLKIDVEIPNINELERNYSSTARFLTLFGNYDICYDFSIDVHKEISNAYQLWRYEYGQKFDKVITPLVTGSREVYFQNVIDILSDCTISEIKESIQNISISKKLVWVDTVLEFILNSNNLDYLRCVESMLIFLSQKT
ncbi:MAG: hypothetical protein ACRC68_06440, partial [Clostridium sp.]